MRRVCPQQEAQEVKENILIHKVEKLKGRKPLVRKIVLYYWLHTPVCICEQRCSHNVIKFGKVKIILECRFRLRCDNMCVYLTLQGYIFF